jgi:hypothetical protein
MKLILSVLFPHLALLAGGLGIVQGLKKAFRWTEVDIFMTVALSYLSGELFVVIFLIFSSLVFSKFLWPGLWACLAGLFIFWLSQIIHHKRLAPSWRRRWKEALSFRTIAPVLLILLVCLPNIKLAFYNSLDLHDARLIWFFHGKAFFYDDRIDPVYLANPEYVWSQPKYPIFIPLLSVYHARFLGYWHEILNKSFVFFHWTVSLVLLYLLLRRRSIPPLFSLLAVVFLPTIFHKNAMVGYADSIWSLAFIIGIELCLSSMENRAKPAGRLLLLLGYGFLSMAALTKNEGLAGSVIFIALYSVAALAIRKHSFKTLLLSLGVYALLVLPWYVFAEIHNFPLYWPKPIFGFLRFSIREIMQRTRCIIIYPFRHHLLLPEMFAFMVGSLGLSLAILLGNIKRARQFLGSWLIFATNILMLVLYFIIYLGTPQQLEYDLTFALERILCVNFMLCLFTLLNLTQIRPTLSSAQDMSNG